ncbi:MAG: DUF2508 family protein [Oscillospiraceae bacterium]|nr:DUF2508 family protein [Oscillospiraceae bacterium]
MQAILNLQEFFTSKRAKTSLFTKKQTTADPILTEIDCVLKQIQNSKSRFDFETDYDMIDACIYEEQALLSRYSHLLSLARKKGLTCSHTENLSVSASEI